MMKAGGVVSVERGTGRAYHSEVREERARRTRLRILDAARDAFIARGYAGTTIRSIATAAGVSVPMVELLFGTKASVLKTAIDVAIAGDDEPVPVLDRPWTEAALRACTVKELLSITVPVLAAAQERSAGLVLAALEASSTDADLAEVSERLVAQRETTAGWLVDRITSLTRLRRELTRQDAVETVWLVMDPAVFIRLTQHRQGTVQRYQDWVARSIRHLLLPDPTRGSPSTSERPPGVATTRTGDST